MTLNDYITLNAGAGSDEDFLRRFAMSEIFFSIESPSDQLKDGPLLASPDLPLQVQTAQFESRRMALFYTTKTDARLSDRLGGLPLIKAAEMTVDLPEVDGMLIQSDGNAWFAADKQTLRHILG